MSKSQTPETDEAWDAVSRTPEGTYDSRTSSMDYAIAMSKHAKKLEIERGQLRRKIHAAEELLHRMIQQSTIVMRDHEDDDAQDDLWETIDHASRFLGDREVQPKPEGPGYTSEDFDTGDFDPYTSKS